MELDNRDSVDSGQGAKPNVGAASSLSVDFPSVVADGASSTTPTKRERKEVEKPEDKDKKRKKDIAKLWAKAEERITGRMLDKFLDEMETNVKGAQYAKLYIEVLEFFMPKQSRVQHANDADNPMTAPITIIPIGGQYTLAASEDEVNTDVDKAFIDVPHVEVIDKPAGANFSEQDFKP